MIEDFRYPTVDEKNLGSALVGRSVAIYWDGDDAFYPATVISFTEESHRYIVRYLNDETGAEYEENLNETPWKISDVIHTNPQSLARLCSCRVG